MEQVARSYLPAAGLNWTLPLYDPLVKLLGMDRVMRTLIDRAALGDAERVLDIGCGTGTFVTLIKRLHPGVAVVGLDPDPKALARARKKAARAGVPVQLDQGFADELPYPNASFDRVFSSFMFHHLAAEDREKTLREVRRVLKPEGSLYLLDFARGPAHEAGGLARWFHPSERMKDNTDSRILALMSQAGYADARKVMEGAIFLGHLQIACYRASVNLSGVPG
jgi:ubiquinone/menaquinone biosynthesis C-methylase UbiE